PFSAAADAGPNRRLSRSANRLSRSARSLSGSAKGGRPEWRTGPKRSGLIRARAGSPMLRDHLLVFDEVITDTPPDPSGFWWTEASFDRKLSRYDEMALFCVVDTLSSTAGDLYVAIFHSGDGITFDQKTGSLSTDGEVHLAWTTAGIHAAWGSDPNADVNPPEPFQDFVRLRMNLVGTGPVRARLYVTLRDSGA